MNKKGDIRALGVIVIIILLVLLYVSYLGIPWLEQHKYLTDVQIPQNISRYNDLKITILISNPEDLVISPYLEIEYNDTCWGTRNYYIQRKEKIPIGSIQAGSIEKYSIEFTPEHGAIGKEHIFKFNFYVNNKIVDTREGIVYVKR